MGLEPVIAFIPDIKFTISKLYLINSFFDLIVCERNPGMPRNVCNLTTQVKNIPVFFMTADISIVKYACPVAMERVRDRNGQP